ncbi:MAG TPA: right-handed parallel beta-helix repeat-containing protein [Pseudonocardiaceae bacterium]
MTAVVGLMFVGLQQGFGYSPWRGTPEPVSYGTQHDDRHSWWWWRKWHRPRPTTGPPTSTTATTTPAPTTTTQPPAPTTTTTTPPPPTSTSNPAPPVPPGALPPNTVPQPGQVGFRGDPATLRVIDGSASGLPAGARWSAGALRITGNVTLDGVFVKGGIQLSGGSLTLTNSIVEGTPSLWATILASRGTVLEVRDSTLRWKAGAGPPGSNWGNGVIHGDARMTIVRNDLSGSPDGIQFASSDSVFEQNWIHDLAMFGDTHNDGVQSYGGDNNVFRYNRIDLRDAQGRAYNGHQNGALFFQPSSGFPLRNVQIVGNWLSGGGFTLRLEAPVTGAVVTGNQFGPYTGGWGDVLVDDSGVSIAQWSGNLDNGGRTIPAP